MHQASSCYVDPLHPVHNCQTPVRHASLHSGRPDYKLINGRAATGIPFVRSAEAVTEHLHTILSPINILLITELRLCFRDKNFLFFAFL